MGKKRIQPYEALKLPDPGSVSFEEPRLLQAYREFCSKLSYTRYGNGIVSDGHYFQFDHEDIFPGKDIPKLCLLSALLHPDRRDLQDIKHKLGAVWRYGRDVLRIKELPPFSFTLGAAFRKFRRFSESLDYQTLNKNTVASEFIGQANSTILHSPGLTWYVEFSARCYNDDWAMILCDTDAEVHPTEAFPTIIGFARMDDLLRNLAAVFVDQEDFYFCHGTIIWPGLGELPNICMLRGAEGENSYGEFFIQLDDHELDYLRKKYGSLENSELLRKIDHILYGYYLSDLTPEFYDDIIEKFGRPKNPWYLENIIKKLDDEEERRYPPKRKVIVRDLPEDHPSRKHSAVYATLHKSHKSSSNVPEESPMTEHQSTKRPIPQKQKPQSMIEQLMQEEGLTEEQAFRLISDTLL